MMVLRKEVALLTTTVRTVDSWWMQPWLVPGPREHPEVETALLRAGHHHVPQPESGTGGAGDEAGVTGIPRCASEQVQGASLEAERGARQQLSKACGSLSRTGWEWC